MFTNKKNLNTFCGGVNTLRETYKEDVEHGKIIIKKVINKPAQLPPYHEYDLTALIQAGVKLEALNPNILGITPIDDSKALSLVFPNPTSPAGTTPQSTETSHP